MSVPDSFAAKPAAHSIREEFYNKVTLSLKAIIFFFSIEHVFNINIISETSCFSNRTNTCSAVQKLSCASSNHITS